MIEVVQALKYGNNLVTMSDDLDLIIIIIIIKNECHSNIIVNRRLQPQQNAAVKVKVSHAAVKSFDRHGVSCKNAQTVQFSGDVEKC